MKASVFRRAICLLLVFIMFFLTVNPIFAAKVTLDEDTFNQLVTRAKMADVLEEEVVFYKTKYQEVVSNDIELSKMYDKNLSVKDQIIASQKEQVAIGLERINIKDGIISTQDKQIAKIKRANFLKNLLVIGVTAGGIAVASHNSDTGAAIGIGAAGILTFLIK